MAYRLSEQPYGLTRSKDYIMEMLQRNQAGCAHKSKVWPLEWLLGPDIPIVSPAASINWTDLAVEEPNAVGVEILKHGHKN